MIVALTGFMASGKTTFGRAAAERLGWDFVDLDALIATRYGTPAEIFAAGGEGRFREIESQLLDEALAAEGPAVLSLGGGTVLRAENLRRIKAGAVIIWLDTSFDIIIQEIGGAERPLVKGKPVEAIRALYDERRPLYAAAADIVFPVVSRNYVQVIADLAQCIRSIQTSPQNSDTHE